MDDFIKFVGKEASEAVSAALPPLPFWAARSFWLTLLTILTSMGNLFGFDLLGLLDVASQNEGAQLLQSAALTVLPAVTGFWAWLERRSPGRRLTLY